MNDRLRIAQIAPVAGPVGPSATGSIEALVWLLTEGLVRRGHEVTLFASGDSSTSARLRARYPHSPAGDPALWSNYELHEFLHAAAAFERPDEFDVVHSHSYYYALPYSRMHSTPVLHTYHVHPTRDVVDRFGEQPRTGIAAVSRYHRSKFAPIADVDVVHNGIDVDRFPFRARGGDYLLFLGHLIPRKAPLKAIAVARRASMRLVMAGKGGDYFDAEVAPHVDGRLVEHIGPVSATERDNLLAGAAALLFTSDRAEPFGLVLVEAMACGTPVAALSHCAVPEIVDSGVTGYHVPDAEALATLLPAVIGLDRQAVRRRVAQRFGHERMVTGYEGAYRRLLARAGATAVDNEVSVR